MIDLKEWLLALTVFVAAQIAFRIWWPFYKKKQRKKGECPSPMWERHKLYMDIVIIVPFVLAAAVYLNASRFVIDTLILCCAAIPVIIMYVIIYIRRRRRQ